MAVIKATITPRTGPNSRPLIYTEDDGSKCAKVKVTIPASSTYATADKVALIHTSAGDFSSQYGAFRIRQVCFHGPFATDGAECKSGFFKGAFSGSTQLVTLRWGGTDGTNGIDDAEITDGTALGTGLINCEASIYYNA